MVGGHSQGTKYERLDKQQKKRAESEFENLGKEWTIFAIIESVLKLERKTRKNGVKK